jgi:hypothetical protein
MIDNQGLLSMVPPKSRTKIFHKKTRKHIPIWKTSLICLLLAFPGILLSYFAIKISNNAYHSWLSFVIFLLLLITSLFSMTALVGGIIITSRFVLWVLHLILTTFGVKTIGIVISSQRCDDNEDVCQCGVYVYRDWLGWEHKFKFKKCAHWPSKEQWNEIMKDYIVGAQSPVYYLAWLPFAHEIQFKSKWIINFNSILV